MSSGHPWDSKKWQLFLGEGIGSCYSQFIPIKLLSDLENWDSSRLFWTGGCCSEVVVIKGLTVPKMANSEDNKLIFYSRNAVLL